MSSEQAETEQRIMRLKYLRSSHDMLCYPCLPVVLDLLLILIIIILLLLLLLLFISICIPFLFDYLFLPFFLFSFIFSLSLSLSLSQFFSFSSSSSLSMLYQTNWDVIFYNIQNIQIRITIWQSIRVKQNVLEFAVFQKEI